MTETSSTTICGPRGLFFKVGDDHRYILEQLKYLMPSAFPGMHIKQHTLGLSIYFGATSRVDIEKLFSHFATPEARSKIYSPFTTLTIHNVLLMIDEGSLRSSIEQQFGQVIQMAPVINPELATKYICSRNWRVHLDQPEIPDSSPFTRNGYPNRMRIQVPHSVQRCATFVVTFYCRNCDKDGHIEREHFKPSTKVATACNSVAAGLNNSSASVDQPITPWPPMFSASSSTSKGLAGNSSFVGADACVVEKDVVGKCNKRSSPCSNVAAGGKLSSASADNLEAIWPFLVSAVASTNKELVPDSAFGAADVCVAEKDVVGKRGKRASRCSTVPASGKRNSASADKSKAFRPSADKSKAFRPTAVTASANTSKGLFSDFAFGVTDVCALEKDVVGKCEKRSSSKTVVLLAPPSYRSSLSGFYIGERTASATSVEETQYKQKAVPKKKGLGACKVPRILPTDDKTETSQQQQVSQSVEIPCAESQKKTASKRAYRKRGGAPDVSGIKRTKSSESKYQYFEMDDKEQCQNIFSNMLLDLSPDSNCPSEEKFLTSKIPLISYSETSFSKTSHSFAEAAASTSGQGESSVIRRGEVVSTSGHDDGSNAKGEGSVPLTLVERYIEDVGPLSLQQLRAFMAHAKKKSNLERVLVYYTDDSGAIVSQLEEVLHRYHMNTDTGTKEDKAFVKTLESLCKRLKDLKDKKPLEKEEVKQERDVKKERISLKKEH